MVGKRNLFSVVKDAFHGWIDDDAFSESASIAYYSVLSLPGLLFLIVYFAGFFFGEQAVQGQLSQQVSQVVGPEAGKFVQTLIKGAAQTNQSNLGLIVGLISVSLSATAVFLQLQKVLNKIFKVKPESSAKAGVVTLLWHRMVSFGLILLIGVLLLASIVLLGAIAVMRDYLTSFLQGASIYVFYGLSFVVVFFLLSLFFGLIYKYLPDARIEWKTVRAGAAITTLLFLAGMVGLQFYFSMSNPASAYGAAGSIILILLWAYYSSLVFLLGAEFTKSYAQKYTRGIIPSKYAVRIAEC